MTLISHVITAFSYPKIEHEKCCCKNFPLERTPEKLQNKMAIPSYGKPVRINHKYLRTNHDQARNHYVRLYRVCIKQYLHMNNIK